MIVSTGFAVIRPKATLDPDYIGYLLQSEGFVGDVVSNSVGVSYPAINASVLARLPVAEPPIAEQRSIAHFLDHKTTQIDALIAKKETLLKKLAEKRTALISQAVTKGLDPTVPMKDSGIDWFGDIPAHWIVSKAKYVSSIFVPQRNKPNLNIEEGIPWLTMDDMASDRISITSFKVTEESAIKAGSKVLKKGSVIASCVGNFGAASINDADLIINQQLQAFIPKAIQPEYLRELVSISTDYFQMIATAATIVYVNQLGFGNMPVLVPSTEEQRIIVEECKKIKNYHTESTNQIRQGISALKEYRTALITNAVTGKIDVRDVKLPDLYQTAQLTIQM